jgi:uncharacterized protein (DUF1501 family)
MYLIQPHEHTRRAFLKRAGQLAFTGAALPTAINLAALGEAAAFNAGDDYKALVCVFLLGGCDYANTLIPADAASYAAYQAIRGTAGSTGHNRVALGRANETVGGVNVPGIDSTLLTPVAGGAPVSVIGQTGLQYALHPSMTGMQRLFNTQKAAVLLNCGPLVVPLTRDRIRWVGSSPYPLPPRLGSHNDQQSVWQSFAPEGARTGWGGRLGDLALSSNGASSLFTCIGTSNGVFLSGNEAPMYQIGSNGALRINAINAPYSFGNVGSAITQMMSPEGRSHALERAYSIVGTRTVNAEATITNALNAFPSTDAPFSTFPGDNPLAVQLRIVARLIAARSRLNIKRQVFMVLVGGFDSHSRLLADHARNMGAVSSAMTAFHEAMESLGAANDVTAFTTSEFGRSLSVNGDGSDHGWGSHHFIVGGAVNGGRFYGYAPPVSVGNTAAPQDQWHIGQGRLIPTTSVSQYAATLAKWFGVENSELTGSASVLPYMDNFAGQQLTFNGTTLTYANDLGFMKPA